LLCVTLATTFDSTTPLVDGDDVVGGDKDGAADLTAAIYSTKHASKQTQDESSGI
jgi:hypothetical protein